MNRGKAIYQLFRSTVFRLHLHLSSTGKDKLTLSFSLSLSLRLSHTHTHAHTLQCDKFTSVTNNAIPIAVVRGSTDQTLHGALLQIQATTLVTLLHSVSPERERAGCCHKGNHAVIHVSALQHVDAQSVNSRISTLVCGVMGFTAYATSQKMPPGYSNALRLML